MQDRIIYDNCISLGGDCRTACSLGRLGLRSHSGPFDWYVSDFEGVLSQIENDFRYFMVRKNLKIVDEAPKAFQDVEYGFCYWHDVENNFDSEYEQIREKYFRRIAWFREAITRPTCFFRTVKDNEEVTYINEKWKDIENILKNKNGKNHIVYILPLGIGKLREGLQVYYSVKVDKQTDTGIYNYRHFFDDVEGLLDFCEICISSHQRQKNFEFDFQVNKKRVIADHFDKCVKENISGIDTSILHALNASKDEGVYIWGAGRNGMPLARYLCERGVVLKGIIDNNISEKTKEGFELVSFDEVEDGAKIFISVYDDKANEEILEQIHKTHKKTTAVGYEDLKELFD